MKKILVQIYEVQTPREAEALVCEGVDHIGSVVLSAVHWKDADLKDTVRQTQALGARNSIIPLFSDVDTICRVIEYYRPDMIHFCEALETGDPSRKPVFSLLKGQQKIKELFPETEIMRSIPIALPGLATLERTLGLAKLFEPWSDWFLTDTLLMHSEAGTSVDRIQPVAGHVGITGVPCDWQVAASLVSHSGIPVILAGGISPENVYEGIMKTKPAGIDSCTKTNALDSSGKPIRFRKDMNKIRRLLEAVRKAESNQIHINGID